MILHIGELWLVLAVAFCGGGLIGSIFFRTIEQSAARRPQAWLIRKVDRLVGRIEHRLMPWREQISDEPQKPILMPPPTFGQAPGFGQPQVLGQASILTPGSPLAGLAGGEPAPAPPRILADSPTLPTRPEVAPIDRRRPGRKLREALARGDAAGMRPLPLKAPRRDSADDLTQIKRVGKRNAARLAGIGIYHFSQIAAWTPKEAAWVAAFLDVGDAISAEDWVGQATRLASSEDFPMVRPEAEAPAMLDADG